LAVEGRQLETVNRVLKGHPGFLQVAVGQVGAVALGAVFWFVMARLLEPGDYGQINWLISIAMFASTCCVLFKGTKNMLIMGANGFRDIKGVGNAGQS
jgi:hypothetical protein